MTDASLSGMTAHKVVLSACSSFFRSVLRRNPHQHPLLYMKGVRYTDLQSVLNFMYHGEVNVAQEDLNGFLAVAEDLRVKGLTQGQGGGQSSNSRPSSSKPQSEPYKPKREETKRPVIPSSSSSRVSQQMAVDDDIQEVVPVKTEPGQAQYQEAGAVGGELQQFDTGEGGYEEGYEDYGQYDDTAIVEGGAGVDAAKGKLSPFFQGRAIFATDTLFIFTLSKIETFSKRFVTGNIDFVSLILYT